MFYVSFFRKFRNWDHGFPLFYRVWSVLYQFFIFKLIHVTLNLFCADIVRPFEVGPFLDLQWVERPKGLFVFTEASICTSCWHKMNVHHILSPVLVPGVCCLIDSWMNEAKAICANREMTVSCVSMTDCVQTGGNSG